MSVSTCCWAPGPVDKRSHESLVTPASISAYTYLYRLPSSCQSPPILNNSTSYHSSWQGHRVPVSVPHWASPVIQIFILIFFFFIFEQFLWRHRMKQGQDEEHEIEFVPSDRELEVFHELYFLLQAEATEPQIALCLSGCHSAPSIWLGAQPPQGRPGLRDSRLFCGGFISSEWQPTVLIKKRFTPSCIVCCRHAVGDV